MNRELKEALEAQLFARCTDGLKTNVDPGMPEEMRWIAAYEEVLWESAPRQFWQHYAVLANRRDHAETFLDPVLIRQLLDRPSPVPRATKPFVLMLLRGKAYMRLQHDANHPAVQHATSIFTTACANALNSHASSAAT